MEKISLTLRLYAEFKKINQIIVALKTVDEVEEFALSAIVELTKTEFETSADRMVAGIIKRYLRSIYLHICCCTVTHLEEYDAELYEFQNPVVDKFYKNNNIERPMSSYGMGDIIDDAKYFDRDVENLVNQFDPIMVKARQEKQRAEKEELEKSIAATPFRDRRGEFFDYNKETIRSIDEFLEKLS